MSSDPNWNDTVRDRIHRRLGLGMLFCWPLQVLALWLHPLSDKWLVHRRHGDEEGDLLVGWRFTAGVVGVDTDVNGMLWGSVTDEDPGAGEALVEIFNDQARSELVAQGSAANGALVTLTPEAGYTLACTVNLGTIGASFDFALALEPPANQLIKQVFDGSEPDDQANAAELQSALATIRTSLGQALSTAATAAGRVSQRILGRRLSHQTTTNTLISPGLNVDSETGAISQSPSGMLEDLRLDQAGNTGGSGEIKAGAPAHGATPTFGGWEGTLNGPTLNVRALPGVLTISCITELGEDAPPTFRVVFTPDDIRRKGGAEGIDNILASNPLTIGAVWKDPALGIETMLLNYKATPANEGGGTSLSATAGDWSVTGLNAANSTEGQVWSRYYASESTLRFYRTEDGRNNDDADDVVAEAVLGTGAVNTVFNTAEDASGLRITGKSGAGTAGALVDQADGNVDFNPPTAQLPASQFTVAIARTVEPSAWVQAMRDGHLGNAPWRPNTGANPNLEDAWLRAGAPLGYQSIDGDITG